MRILDSSPLGKAIFNISYRFLKTTKHIEMKFPVDPIGNLSVEVWISTYDYEDYRVLNVSIQASRLNISGIKFKINESVTKREVKSMYMSFENELKELIINLHDKVRSHYEQAKGELMVSRPND